jgi:2-hydroxychromene-2-carboxylate isomerase
MNPFADGSLRAVLVKFCAEMPILISMGDLIMLEERLAERAARRHVLPDDAFFFDLSRPFSYLAAEQIERGLGQVEWIPAAASALHDEPWHPEAAWADAERCAAELRVALVWPEGFPGDPSRALRVASYAAEIGCGARFALAASRLAFCGGFNLEDPAILGEAAAAAGMSLKEALAASRDARRDRSLDATARALRAHSVSVLPAIRVAGQWFEGEHAVGHAAALVRASSHRLRLLVPTR